MTTSNSSIPYTAEEDAQILADYAADIPRSETAAALGRSAKSVSVRLNRIGGTRKPAAAESPRRKRPCLRCSNEFMSDGPHNRLCAYCRGVNATASPYAL